MDMEITGYYSTSASAMEDRALDRHVLFVWQIEDEMEAEVLHPESCAVWVGTSSDWAGRKKHYECAVSSEIDHVGFDSMFPDGLEPGWWLLHPWFSKTPSTPNGPPEYDAGIEVTALSELE